MTYKLPTLNMAVNTKTREHGSQSSRKLKMAPVTLKDGSHFGSRTFWVIKIALMSPLTTSSMTQTVYIKYCTGTQIACYTYGIIMIYLT